MIKVKLLKENAKVPAYGSAGAACFDFYATESLIVPSNGSCVFGTGISMEIPEGKALMIYPRSGLAFKYDIRLSNCTAVIDSDFRGEIMIKLISDSQGGLMIDAGDRIAQGMIVDAPRHEFEVVDELSDTERGNGGFGSTGK